MDANGTRYQLLLGPADWGRCLDQRGRRLDSLPDEGETGDELLVAWEDARAAVRLRARAYRFRAAGNDRRPTQADRRGAARDRFGTWYWIDATRTRILAWAPPWKAPAMFWRTSDGAASDHATRRGAFGDAAARAVCRPVAIDALAITADHYLVVGVPQPAGLLVFDLHAGGAPTWRPWHTDEFRPRDMTHRADGGVWILDGANGGRLWELDRHLRVLGPVRAVDPARTALFQPAAGGAERVEPPSESPEGYSLPPDPMPGEAGAIAIEGLPDRSVLVLRQSAGARFPRIERYLSGGSSGGVADLEVVLAVVDESEHESFRLDGFDLAFVASQNPPRECVLVVSGEGNQACAFDVAGSSSAWTLNASAEYFPMRRFGGKGLVSTGERAYYDFEDRWIPLVEQCRPRFEGSATIFTPIAAAVIAGPPGAAEHAFDAREPGCVWHRLMLDASLPPGTEVRVQSRAADAEEQLVAAAWQDEPRPYRRLAGSEIPFAPSWPGEHEGTFELLFQQARGRFLQLRLELRGDRRATPRLHALRAYYPRFSLVERYLPAVYREDATSASFLERYLANAEGTMTSLEDRIASIHMMLDVATTRSDALEWLASWVGLTLDPSWTERQRRFMIRNALAFFEARGTTRGLRLAVLLALGECVEADLLDPAAADSARSSGIRIIELYRTRTAAPVEVGDPSDLLPGTVPTTGQWRLADGAAALQLRFSSWCAERGGAASETTFRPQPPDDAPSRSLWSAFARSTLGFVPGGGPNAPAWRSFLSRRHRSVQALNDAHRTGWSSFEVVPWPTDIPTVPAALEDWVVFQNVIATRLELAHRFRVLVPLRPGDPAPYRQARRLEQVRRVVELEKPAHTAFEVRFFWNAFRVDEVVLGQGTPIDLGGRLSWPPLVAGFGYLSEGVLASANPDRSKERRVLDSDSDCASAQRGQHIAGECHDRLHA